MCGIVGYWDKTQGEQAPVGQIIFQMMQALGRRGPDSAGVALFTHQHDGDLVVRVKLGEAEDPAGRGKRIAERVQRAGATLGEIATNADYLRLVIDDQPGMLGKVATCLGEAGANILEVSHRRMFLDVPAKGTTLDVMMETKDARHAAEIMAKLERSGFSVFRVDF